MPYALCTIGVLVGDTKNKSQLAETPPLLDSILSIFCKTPTTNSFSSKYSSSVKDNHSWFSSFNCLYSTLSMTQSLGLVRGWLEEELEGSGVRGEKAVEITRAAWVSARYGR